MPRHPWDGGEPQQPLQKIAAKHRAIARLLVRGIKQRDIAELLDMTEARLSVIVHSPAFQEHLETLESEADKKAIDVSHKISSGTKRGLDILLNVLDDTQPEAAEATIGQRIQVAQDFLDRNASTSKVSRSQSESVVAHVTKEELDEILKSKRSIRKDRGNDHAIDVQ